jgi:farnesyl-diphosphate farnesyltransferase
MLHGQGETQRLLRQVSRSFYLTLRILPRSVRHPISLAYLLARASDTIADTRLIAVSRRREALLQLKNSVLSACEGKHIVLPKLGDLAEAQEEVTGEGTPGERGLLMHLEDLLCALDAVDQADLPRISRLLATIIQGQETDLVQFDASPGQLSSFHSDQELDGYTYAVAGCVGEFWTEMCRAHVFPSDRLDDATLRANAIRFGKGLQLVNILRDIPNDLRRNRCYIPGEKLLSHGLNPEDLLQPSTMARFRPLYHEYLQLAVDHLSAGWQYTVSLPFRCLRIRLACAWPVLIGIQTLAELRNRNVLDNNSRIKIDRPQIRSLVLRSILLYPLPACWNRLFDPARALTAEK